MPELCPYCGGDESQCDYLWITDYCNQMENRMNSISWALDKLREGRCARRAGKTGWLTLHAGVLFLQGKDPRAPERIKYWHPKQEDVIANDWEDVADRPLPVEKDVVEAALEEGKAADRLAIDPFANVPQQHIEDHVTESIAADQKRQREEFERKMTAGLKKEQHPPAKPAQPTATPPQTGLMGSKEIPPKTNTPG